MAERIRTVIVGAGQGGLATSYFLSQQGHEHVILDQAAQAANAWRSDRWESFALNTPNVMCLLPGMPYQGDDPHGFLSREEIVALFDRYVETFRLPVRGGVRVERVTPLERGYRVQTSAGDYDADQVVIATGLYQHHRALPCSDTLPAWVMQYHTGSYRSPAALPPGAVLVVGSAQSGCQVAEDLYQNGRTVYLATCTAGRAPRRYRGADTVEWLVQIGFFDRTPDKLPSPRARFGPNPQISGTHGGHDINLHRFKRDGVILLGRMRDAHDGKATFAPDLHDNLAKSDQFEVNLLRLIDGQIAAQGLDAPPDSVPDLRDGYDEPIREVLDLRAEGITSVIWAMGYSWDFSLVQAPVFDEDGFPVTRRGVTRLPGLYFAGMPWLDSQKTGLLAGVAETAGAVAADILARG